VHRDAEVEGLCTPPAGVAVGEGGGYGREDGVVGTDAAALDEGSGIFEGLPDGLAAWDLADAGVAIGVFEYHQVSGEERAVGAAEVEQHAVVARNGDHPHVGDDGGAVWRAHIVSVQRSVDARPTLLSHGLIANEHRWRPSSTECAVSSATRRGLRIEPHTRGP
jgi:hypothetical protein